MPVASGAGSKYAYVDYDTAVNTKTPPVQNTWYTVLNETDVRLLYCVTYQKTDDAVSKNMEMRWTIDGNVYFIAVMHPNDDLRYYYRIYEPSTGGTLGLYVTATDDIPSAKYVEKRGHSFKVEVRMTSAAGANQTMSGYCAYEKLEAV